MEIQICGLMDQAMWLIKAGFAVDEKIYGKSKGMAGTDEPWIASFYQKAE